jgi:hypothetical protein
MRKHLRRLKLHRLLRINSNQAANLNYFRWKYKENQVPPKAILLINQGKLI